MSGRTYEKAGDQLHEIVAEVMEQYHGPLHDAEVTVDIMLAFAGRDANDDLKGPAIVCGGYPAKAVVRATTIKERAYGHADVEIVLDGDNWDTWSDEELRAILDHELCHVEFTGKTDDLDRPKLKMRGHDFQIGVFESVVRRHGENAGEVMQLRGLLDGGDPERMQLMLPFCEVEAEDESRLSVA